MTNEYFHIAFDNKTFLFFTYVCVKRMIDQDHGVSKEVDVN